MPPCVVFPVLAPPSETRRKILAVALLQRQRSVSSNEPTLSFRSGECCCAAEALARRGCGQWLTPDRSSAAAPPSARAIDGDSPGGLCCLRSSCLTYCEFSYIVFLVLFPFSSSLLSSPLLSSPLLSPPTSTSLPNKFQLRLSSLRDCSPFMGRLAFLGSGLERAQEAGGARARDSLEGIRGILHRGEL